MKILCRSKFCSLIKSMLHSLAHTQSKRRPQPWPRPPFAPAGCPPPLTWGRGFIEIAPISRVAAKWPCCAALHRDRVYGPRFTNLTNARPLRLEWLWNGNDTPLTAKERFKQERGKRSPFLKRNLGVRQQTKPRRQKVDLLQTIGRHWKAASVGWVDSLTCNTLTAGGETQMGNTMSTLPK